MTAQDIFETLSNMPQKQRDFVTTVSDEMCADMHANAGKGLAGFLRDSIFKMPPDFPPRHGVLYMRGNKQKEGHHALHP